MCPFINPEKVKNHTPSLSTPDGWQEFFCFIFCPDFCVCLAITLYPMQALGINLLSIIYIVSPLNNTCLGYLSGTIRTDIHFTSVWVKFGWVLDFGETSLIYPRWDQTSLMWSLLLPLIIQTVGIYYTQTWPKSQLCHRSVSIIRTRLPIGVHVHVW